MKITVVYGQNHKGSTYRIARMLAEKLDGDISEIFLPRDFGEFCVGCAKCILHDAKDCPHAESLQPLKTSWNRLTEAEHRNLVRELLSPQLNHMFVTPKDIDAEIKRMSYTISEAINLAFCG
jgi:hypothetical protein